ncbi:KaiC [Candidatus Methanoperedenaceae archaeon GB50]|nr:MAG: KaiC [Candidatus Methanoperedenaceae archaeon GB50]CAD7775057.1 KaiC [Candidatus Methanoperedenaceae archaeon GB50]
MVTTGIPKLDDYLGGGIPPGKTVLYYNHPGVEGDIFIIHALYHNILAGRKSIYLTLSSDPQIFREEFMSLGWKIEEHAEKFILIDAYSSLIGSTSGEEYVVDNPEDIGNIDRIVRRALDDSDENLLLCCPLSAIMDLCGVEETLKVVVGWNKRVGDRGQNIIYHFTAWPYPSEVLERIKEELFNAVIEIGGIRERVIFGQYFAVVKADWTRATGKTVLFKVVRPGGVRLYIPKILVTGPFNAGKSSFVRALSTKSVSVDRNNTTVALDYGHVDHKGMSADIFGTPGQERFDPILRMLSSEAMGIFLVLDSTRPRDFERAKKMLEMARSYGLPYIIIANKQDLDGALSPDEIRRRFNVPDDVPIVPTIATEKKGVFEAFELLVERIMEDK